MNHRNFGNIKLIELDGEPYQIGFQAGRQLEKETKTLIEKGFNQYLPNKRLDQKIIFSIVKRIVNSVKKDLSEEYLLEFKGVSDATGISLNKILIWNVLDEVFNRINSRLVLGISKLMGMKVVGCSTLAIHQPDKMIVAQTVDYPLTFLSGHSVIYRIKKKNTIIMPSFPALLSGVNGMNDKGLVLTQRATPILQKRGHHGDPLGSVTRKILENCSTIPEARDILHSSNLVSPRSILVADSKSNTSSLFEIMNGEILEIKTKGFVAAANHYKTKRFAEIQKKHALKMNKELDYDNSIRREKYLKRAAKPNLTIKKLTKIFQHYEPGLPGVNPTVSHKQTIQSVFFVPEDKAIYAAIGNKPPVTLAGYRKIPISN